MVARDRIEPSKHPYNASEKLPSGIYPPSMSTSAITCSMTLADRNQWSQARL
jgi:hypothetical protein